MQRRTLLAGMAAALCLLMPLSVSAADAATTVTTSTEATETTTTVKTTPKTTKTTTTTAKSTTKPATTTTKTTAKTTKPTTTTAKSTTKPASTTTKTTAKTTKSTTTAKSTTKPATTTTKTTAKTTKSTTTTEKSTKKTTKATTETTTEYIETTETTETAVRSGLWEDENGQWYFYQEGEVCTELIEAVPEILVGDVQGDGIADAVDASLILNAAAKEGAEGISASELLVLAVPDKPAGELQDFADIGSDGRIDAQDAAEILTYSAQEGADESPLPLGYAAYYADADGVLQSGFICVDVGETYYADENYRLHRGWLELDGKSYYFGADYRMLTGWQELENEWYLFAADGTAMTGFMQIEESVNYFGNKGKLAIGWQEIDGEQYYFDKDGTMVTGITEVDGTLCRFTADGVYKPLKLCLDAGHYAKYNRSPVVPAYWESEMTWKLHLYLKAELESYGITVITTRPEQEKDLGVVARGKLAQGCDLLLSLHSDAIGNAVKDNPTAYCCISGKLDALGKELTHTVESVIGTAQKGEIRNRVGDDGEDYYGILRGAASVGVPGILMEHSYHTNSRTAQWLLSEENLRRLAREEAKVISEYYLR